MGHARIISPYFVDHTPWPYIRGPIYTRPVFAEHSRAGNFVASPVVRMPSLSALGCMQAPGSYLDLLGRAQGITHKGCAGLGDDGAAPTPESICAVAQPAGAEAYSKCLSFNRELAAAVASDPAKAAQMTAKLQAADAKCQSDDLNTWARCYYGELVPTPWYANPWYVGAGIVALAVVLGLATQRYRARE